jgi:hypothetical protein
VIVGLAGVAGFARLHAWQQRRFLEHCKHRPAQRAQVYVRLHPTERCAGADRADAGE